MSRKIRFDYFNDTKRNVHIHSASVFHGCEIKDDKTDILPEEIATFYLPPNTYPWVKMWDYGQEKGLWLFVSPTKYPEEEEEEC